MRRLHTSAALAACVGVLPANVYYLRCCCTSVPQGLSYKQPMLEHPGDFEGTTHSSTILAPPARHTAASKP